MKKKNKGNENIEINKENFLQVLKSISIKDMQELIEAKGKEPKMFCPIMHDRREVYESNTSI